MDDRAFRIHFARVHLNECRARRHSRVNRDFYWRLFASAQNARRQAAAMRAAPAQGGLFA